MGLDASRYRLKNGILRGLTEPCAGAAAPEEAEAEDEAEEAEGGGAAPALEPALAEGRGGIAMG
jgi:hypothetical protein